MYYPDFLLSRVTEVRGRQAVDHAYWNRFHLHLHLVKNFLSFFLDLCLHDLYPTIRAHMRRTCVLLVMPSKMHVLSIGIYCFVMILITS